MTKTAFSLRFVVSRDLNMYYKRFILFREATYLAHLFLYFFHEFVYGQTDIYALLYMF